MRSRPILNLLLWGFVLLGAVGPAFAQDGPSDGLAFLRLVAADEDAGRITTDEGLLLKLQYGFAPEDLPVRYRVNGFSPLRCATDIVAAYQARRADLPAATVDLVDGWLQPATDKATYLSAQGRFQFTYSTTGADAVPTEDTAPTNGIPDYVERMAEHFETSWDIEVDLLGYAAPPLGAGPYDVSFEDMQYYGYTSQVNAATGATRIVMHNTYAGFPPNQDPEGNEIGAARATAAHEFKHAVQYVSTRWAEGGWLELDATWMEDVVFDQVNDFYNYLPGESPLARPDLPLDGGENTTGSYEDCVWQTWLGETWGLEAVAAFWDRRETNTAEPVMESYRAVLNARGVTLAEAWAAFTAWNHGAGTRTVTGLGYEEAAGFPTGPVLDTAVAYPFTTSGSVEHLAAGAVRLQGFAADSGDQVRITFAGADGTGPLTLALHITRRDGTGLIETIALDAANDADHVLSVPVRDILAAGLVVGNAATFGLAADWSLTVDLEPIPAVPAAGVSPAAVNLELASGAQGSVGFRLENTGEAGSVLDYAATVWTAHPDSGRAPAAAPRSVAGSQVTCTSTSYLPGQLLNLDFAAYNGSTDDEWLTDVELGFPAGVQVLLASDFVGGSLGDLAWQGETGDGATPTWFGTSGTQGYGVVRGGETALGTVQVVVDAGFSGPLDIAWTVQGDIYGTTPHSLSGTITLVEDSPTLTLTTPAPDSNHPVAAPLAVTWSTGGVVGTVHIDLSRDGGATWETLVSDLPNSGAAAPVPGGPASNACVLRIRAADGAAEAETVGLFRLFATPGWIASDTLAGQLTAGTGADLDWPVDATGLAAGVYPAWAVVAHDAPGSRTVVPLELTVLPVSSAVPNAGGFALRGAWPNPFNPRTHVGFSLAAPAEVAVDVLDVRGRLVRHLALGRREAGPHVATWDGHDGNGRAAGAGVYLVRVRAGVQSGTVKVLLAK